MSIRIILLWIIVSVIVGVYLYFVKRKGDKKQIKIIVWKSLACGSTAAAILAVLIYGINNIQGV